MVSNSQKKLILQKKRALKNKRLKLEKKSTTENKRIISNVRQLNWKPVPIPDTLGDYEGLYGIEEIDGVAVKLIDGQMKYIVTDDDKVRSEEDAKLNDNAIPEGDFEVEATEREEIEVEEQVEADDGQYEQEQEIEEELEEEEEEEEEEEQKEEIELKEQLEEVNAVNNESDFKDESGKKVEGKNKPESKESKSIITRLISSKEEDDEENVPTLSDFYEQSKPIKQLKQCNKEEKLTPNMFNKLSDDTELPTDEAYLPNWSTIPLSPFTLNGLSKLNFTSPTEIQKHTIPIALEGKDLIGKAITGSGKTLAYGIPILEKALANLNSTTPVGIIFTPTRELANQVMKHLKELVKYSPLSDKSIVSLTGGLSILKQERLLSYNPKILVATPGRCLEILEKSTAIATQLASIDFLVMDEADRLLQNGHFEELDKILEILSNYRPNVNNINKFKNRWQSLVFSATFSKDLFGKLDSNKNENTDNEKKRKNTEDENRAAEVKEVLHLLGKKLRFKGKPAYIDVNPTEMVASRISEAMMPCSPKDRDLMLYYFLSIFPGSTLVFTNSIDSVKRLAPTLNNLGIPTVSLHSSMIQKQRLRSIERFNKNCQDAIKTKKSSVLIASDVAARGLDVPGIQHVVHYHLPRTADTYIHRSGRTARAGKEGVSVVLCSPSEASGPLRKLRRIVSKKDEVEDLRILPVETDVLDQLKERMFLGAKLAQAEVSSQSVKKEQNWIEKAAEELGVEDLDDFEDDFLKRDRKRKEGKTLDKQTSRAMKAELRELLSSPIRRSGRRSYITGGLNNIAELLMKNEGADHIMGYLQQDALSVLKNTKQNKKRKL